ncbi:hypothetical protein [Streptomyces sp. NPDC051567]|uniref:hypothetical protein n=1 Tax=Streptomyces sp. NPDC051567 TaxID=3365660 RepID=UPI0037A19EFA
MKSFLAEGKTSRVTAAELIAPPLYVADLLDLEPGDQVVRREWLAGRGKTRTVFAVTWYPAPFAALVPDLLNTAPGRNHGLSARVLEATGRTITPPTTPASWDSPSAPRSWPAPTAGPMRKGSSSTGNGACRPGLPSGTSTSPESV